ncbi:hypothetical protein TNCV_4458711 [Trichonephila clavipes]|nr:hypothetical protein TNCV_4458711 [Trichonephila clavipes]
MSSQNKWMTKKQYFRHQTRTEGECSPLIDNSRSTPTPHVSALFVTSQEESIDFRNHKMYRLGPESNPQPQLFKTSDIATTSPSLRLTQVRL